ncbi:MAG TPA: hypothetical protein VH062_02115 [Polyangiaceae bacterium]|jgi:hypothetical protein|nr:hypothetical protein [Polyangiaceae bacterium]
MMNGDEPVNTAGWIKFLAGVIAILAAKYLPSLGMTDAQALTLAGMAFGVISWVFTRLSRIKVAPLSKIARVMGPDERAALMAKLASAPPRSAAVTMLVLLAALVAITGCAGSFEEAAKPRMMLGTAAPPRDQHHCDSLDSDHQLFTRAAWADGIVSGGTGVAAGIVSDKGWRIGLASTAGAFAALAVAATKFSSDAATEWAQDCSDAPTPAVGDAQ